MKIITESELVLPSLRALLKSEDDGLSTSALMELLREAKKPEGDDDKTPE